MAPTRSGSISGSVSDFSIVCTPAPSGFDSMDFLLSERGDKSEAWSAIDGNSVAEPSPNISAAAGKPASEEQLTSGEAIQRSREAKLSAAEKKTMKEIYEKAGRSDRRYHEMTIEKLNAGRDHLVSPPAAAIPEEGELIGDQKPGYADIPLTEKLLA